MMMLIEVGGWSSPENEVDLGDEAIRPQMGGGKL
jgi:hypothetical protein